MGAEVERREALTGWQVRYFEKAGCLQPARAHDARSDRDHDARFYSAVDVALLRTAIKLTEHFWSRLGIWSALLYLSDELRAEFAAGRSSKWLMITNTAMPEGKGAAMKFRAGRVVMVSAREAARVPASHKLSLASILAGVDAAVSAAEAEQVARAWRPLRNYQAAAQLAQVG